jgi:hypothetical protein
LWIVAPIIRAVYDKASKTLLGDFFRRQLEYDGGLFNVTFICFKTDDILVTEAISSLGIEGIKELEEQSDDYRASIRNIGDKIKLLEEPRLRNRTTLSRTRHDIKIWKELQSRQDDGEKVYALVSATGKRQNS